MHKFCSGGGGRRSSSSSSISYLRRFCSFNVLVVIVIMQLKSVLVFYSSTEQPNGHSHYEH
jgi:hypothetical protein